MKLLDPRPKHVGVAHLIAGTQLFVDFQTLLLVYFGWRAKGLLNVGINLVLLFLDILLAATSQQGLVS
jgi:hypothetical protein